MTRSHLNLSQRSNDPNETIEHSNNRCLEFCSTYYAREKE